MPVSVSQTNDNGASIEVIPGDGVIYLATIPREFFDDELGDAATIHDWIEWVAANAEDVSKAVEKINTGGFVDARYRSFQPRGTK